MVLDDEELEENVKLEIEDLESKLKQVEEAADKEIERVQNIIDSINKAEKKTKADKTIKPTCFGCGP